MLRLWLGGLLVGMSLGQASDLPGFARLLAAYAPASSPVLNTVAAMVVVAELLAGIGLVTRWAPLAATVALMIAVAWAAVAVEAFARGVTIANCGCFGVHLAQPLRWWVLLEDAGFVSTALAVRRAVHRSSQLRIRGGGVTAVTAATLRPAEE